jgi:hypothetical protein
MKDVGKLQAEFIQKIEKKCTFAKVRTQKMNEQSAMLFIAAKEKSTAEKKQ